MSASSAFKMIKATADVLDALRDRGFTAEVGDDFQRYGAYCLARLDGSRVPPMFDTSRSMIPNGSAFWICGFDSGGTLAHTQAVRLLDVRNTHLADHLREYALMYCEGEHGHLEAPMHFRGPTSLAEISGMVAFAGDFWSVLHGSETSEADTINGLFGRLAALLVSQTWDADFLFSLGAGSELSTSMQTSAGYLHFERGDWVNQANEVFKSQHVFWMKKSDLKGLASVGGI